MEKKKSTPNPSCPLPDHALTTVNLLFFTQSVPTLVNLLFLLVSIFRKSPQTTMISRQFLQNHLQDAPTLRWFLENYLKPAPISTIRVSAIFNFFPKLGVGVENWSMRIISFLVKKVENWGRELGLEG